MYLGNIYSTENFKFWHKQTGAQSLLEWKKHMADHNSIYLKMVLTNLRYMKN